MLNGDVRRVVVEFLDLHEMLVVRGVSASWHAACEEWATYLVEPCPAADGAASGEAGGRSFDTGPWTRAAMRWGCADASGVTDRFCVTLMRHDSLPQQLTCTMAVFSTHANAGAGFLPARALCGADLCRLTVTGSGVVSSTEGQVTDVSITAVAQHCPQLQHLDVGFTKGQVTDASITALVQHCPQLQYLDVSYTEGRVTDASIIAVAQHCPQLQHLDVSYTEGRVTDASITALVQHCPQLQRLDVSGTDGRVTDASIIAVAQHCPQLQHLNVGNTAAG